jgi:hypothetical protein
MLVSEVPCLLMLTWIFIQESCLHLKVHVRFVFLFYLYILKQVHYLESKFVFVANKLDC